MKEGIIMGSTKITGAKIQRFTRKAALLTYHRFKQLIFFGALFGCIGFGLRCMTLEVQLADYRIALADMKAYQIAHGIAFESESENPEVMIARYKAHVDKANQAIARAEEINMQDQELKGQLHDVLANMSELDLQNASLIASNEEYYNQLQAFSNRDALYDKYSWALYNKLGERNDLTFEQLKTGEDILIAAGLDPNLLFGFICAESDGNEHAENPTSTAAGYGQVLASTGRNVYEKIMNNGPGTFSYDMLLDGDINIVIASNYLAYLKEHSTSVYEIIDGYAGKHDEAYYRKLDEILQKGGTSLAEIDKNTYHATEPLEPTTDGTVELMIADVD
jgi:hypothetical protein